MLSTRLPEFIYLHGFASGPASMKAKYFADKLRKCGSKVHVPDLNGEDFQNLTLTNQLLIIEQIIKSIDSDNDVVVLGSSLGGLLATMSAIKFPVVKALILFAPGFGLNQRWHDVLGIDRLQEWREKGHIEVFHYAFNDKKPLNYTFMEDVLKHQTDDLVVSVPTLIFHGTNDDVVPLSASKKFVDANPKFATLDILESDHLLVDTIPYMWNVTRQFLQKQGVPIAVESAS